MKPETKAILETILKEYVVRNRKSEQEAAPDAPAEPYPLWIDSVHKQVWFQPHDCAEVLVLHTQVGCACFLEALLQNGYAIMIPDRV